MTQIKIFSETTFKKDIMSGPNAPVIDDLQKKVNDFLAEKADEITVKDIKYSIQSPNPGNRRDIYWQNPSYP